MKNNIVSVITFVPVKPSLGGPNDLALSISKKLYCENRLGKIICTDYDARASGIPEEYFSVPNKIALKLLYRGLSLTKRLFFIRERRLREELFDFFVCRSEALLSAKIALFLKPAFPMTVEKASKHGIITIGWASVFHPQFNYKQVQVEQKRFALTDISNYTDEKRVRNLSRYFTTIEHLFVQSEFAAQTFRAHGIPEKNIHLLSRAIGIDCKRFSPKKLTKKNDGFKVLHLSHMDLIKGVGYLFEAWKNLHLENAKLILAGNANADVRTVFNKIAPPNTVFWGHVSDTPASYKNVDVFISPSISDVRPYTVLEAMACGTPVIVSNMCGLSTVVSHGRDGFVYQYDNVDELQKYIMWCYENREKLAGMGLAARKKALQYPRQDFASTIIKAIDRLSEQKRPAV